MAMRKSLLGKEKKLRLIKPFVAGAALRCDIQKKADTSIGSVKSLLGDPRRRGYIWRGGS
jgi:hypothetical protein